MAKEPVKKRKPAKKLTPPKRGRPTKYSPDIAAVICGLISSGQSLRKICSLESMPHQATILAWLFNPSDFRESFHEQYRRARAAQAELMADEMIDIADDSTEDEIFTDEGKRLLNKEFVQRSKLRVETRQWIASRLLPKVYGTIKADSSDEDDAPPPARVIVEVKDARKPSA